MPRITRNCPADLPVHVIQRGNNRQTCFASDSDFKAFAHWLFEGASRFSVCIHAWVFMTNHVHLLMTPSCPTGISRAMQFLGGHYVRYFNYQYKRSGTLYEGRFKSSIVQNKRYLLACQRDRHSGTSADASHSGTRILLIRRIWTSISNLRPPSVAVLAL